MKKEKKPGEQPPIPKYAFRDLCMEEIPADRLREAFMPLHEACTPVEELLAVCEATYEFIRTCELDIPTRNAFYRLEKQFYFFKDLVEK